MTIRDIQHNSLKENGALLPGDLGASITDAFPAVLSAIGISVPNWKVPLPSLDLPPGKQACVVLVDGMGFSLLQEYLGHASFLRSLFPQSVAITTCWPSTTAAAITAFSTGKLPGVTGMLSYSVYDEFFNTEVNLLSFAGSPIPAEQWQKSEPLFSLVNKAGGTAATVSPGRFAGSGLTAAALRGSRHVAADKMEERIAATCKELRNGTMLTYFYWSELDHMGHLDGGGSDAWLNQLEILDSGLQELYRRLPKDTVFLITADHGMVNTSSKYRTDIAEHPELLKEVHRISGEPRAVHLHTEPGKEVAVRRRWAEFLGDKAWVLDPTTATKLLGGTENQSLLGGGVVISRGRNVIVDSRTQSPGMVDLIGVHGGLNPSEMTVPFISVTK